MAADTHPPTRAERDLHPRRLSAIPPLCGASRRPGGPSYETTTGLGRSERPRPSRARHRTEGAERSPMKSNFIDHRSSKQFTG